MIDKIVEKLIENRSLSIEEYTTLIDCYTPEIADYLAKKAEEIRKEIYGDSVYIRGLIEVSNHCKNDCYYCGIRRSNLNCKRYRLSPDEIFACTNEGYNLGFRTFVLQGGEDGYYTDDLLCKIIAKIKNAHPDCAVTLSLGERGRDSFQKLYDAGASRYLLRHETADCAHYARLHPKEMRYENRIKSLYDLREIGYQVGCGFMVGSPFQNSENLAKDLKFIEEFKPQMCGIGPFIPHCDTPFASEKAGSGTLTCYLLSIVRIICPGVLLPATTALGTIDTKGRQMGIKSGANVVMPNLSPMYAKEKYTLYNGKIHSGSESAYGLEALKAEMKKIGYEIVIDKGDAKIY